MAELRSSFPRRRRPLNWDLIVGAAIVALILGVAVAGPLLAMHDPLETFPIIKVGDRWVAPPYPAMTVPGFPLGTDEVSRDILSRLLWAVRPTLVMVAVVAAARLLLGTLIGLAAGWSTGRLGNVLEALITGALAVPVLLVALWVIAAVGVELGIWAFIFGLGITGWAETARLVQEHVREIRAQAYVESARALGASDLQVLLSHALRQLTSRIWVLLSLEVSSTLLVVAGLGFLGYYVGGDVWIEVEDYVAARVSGLPELGQMLASAIPADNFLLAYFAPWQMVAVGTTLFLSVLGFQLLGQGLAKRTLVPTYRGAPAFLAGWIEAANDWFEDRVGSTIRRGGRRRALALVGSLGVVAVLVGAFVWSKAGGSGGLGPALTVPGGHLWGSERHDPYGTQYTEEVGPASPELKVLLTDPAGFSGGPAIAADGSLYIGSKRGALLALAIDGSLRWEAPLAAPAFGAPALSEDGVIYVADEEGGLSAFTPEGDPVWRVLPENHRLPTSSPIAGPNGNAYYTTGGLVNAVSPQGELLWQTQALPFQLRTSSLAFSPDGDNLFWEDLMMRSDDGKIESFEVVRQIRQRYVVGASGQRYIMSGNSSLVTWVPAESGPEITETRSWPVGDITVQLPEDLGVMPDGVVWLYYSRSFLGGGRGVSRLLWGDLGGKLLQETDLFLYPPSSVVGADREGRLYVCGFDLSIGTAACLGATTEDSDPLWSVPLDEASEVVGGAIASGKLFAAALAPPSPEGADLPRMGYLYVLEDP